MVIIWSTFCVNVNLCISISIATNEYDILRKRRQCIICYLCVIEERPVLHTIIRGLTCKLLWRKTWRLLGSSCISVQHVLEWSELIDIWAQYATHWNKNWLKRNCLHVDGIQRCRYTGVCLPLELVLHRWNGSIFIVFLLLLLFSLNPIIMVAYNCHRQPLNTGQVVTNPCWD